MMGDIIDLYELIKDLERRIEILEDSQSDEETESNNKTEEDLI